MDPALQTWTPRRRAGRATARWGCGCWAFALDALAAGDMPRRVLLCAHSGVLRMLAAIAADGPEAAAILGPSTGNGEALELRYAAPAMPRFLASSAAMS